MAAKRTESKTSKAPADRKSAVRRKRQPKITHDDIATSTPSVGMA